MTSESILEAGLTPLERGRAIQAAKRAAGIAPERLDPIAKAMANPTSLRAAIRECGIESCTLWAVRPYRNVAAREDEVSELEE